jgi:EmrB/QacA subfamily drug resistance transporter
MGGEVAKAETELRAGWKGWTMVAVILGSGVVFLDTSVVNLALRRIGLELSSSLFARFEAQSYVVNGYFLTLSSLLILAGALTDYFGRRRVFSIGLIGFGVTSLLCAVAWNMESLILFRLLQGAAGAVVVPGSLAIITASFQGEERGKAFGLWAAASAATAILGPTVGGLLVNTVSWRAAFLINIPFLLVASYGAFRYMPESRDEEASGRFDWLGSIVGILAVGGLVFGTIRGQERGWTAPEALASLIVGAAATLAFPILMKVRKHPLVPLGLFRSRNFTVTNISTFVIYGALYVSFFLLGVFLVGTLGYSEPAAGIALMPDAILLALFSTKFGQLAARYGPRFFMAVGPAVMGLGLFILLRVPADSDPWLLAPGEWGVPPGDYFVHFLPGLLVFGIGLMIMVAPLVTALMTSVEPKNSGVASAINNAISRVGSPFVLAAIFVAVTSSFYGTIAERVPAAPVGSVEFRQEVAPLNPPGGGVDPEVAAAAKEASTDAFHLGLIVAAGLMFAGAAVNGFGIRNPARQPTEAERRAQLERAAQELEAPPCLPVAATMPRPLEERGDGPRKRKPSVKKPVSRGRKTAAGPTAKKPASRTRKR